MTRLRILELPHRPGNEPPFAVVFDQINDETDLRASDLAEKFGARCAIAFTGAIDLPGDDQTLAPVHLAEREEEVLRNEIEWLRERIELLRTSLREAFDLPDDAALDVTAAAREQLDDARSWARHGYEIGQRHCGWTDHGVAPAWLTDGWPPHIEACEHTARAAEYDTALARVRELPESPQAVDALTSDPAGYARGYRDAIRDAKRAARGEASS
jgi:hypothetical protein